MSHGKNNQSASILKTLIIASFKVLAMLFALTTRIAGKILTSISDLLEKAYDGHGKHN